MSDLYKAEITIPVAFATAEQDNPYKALKVNMRNKIQETGLIKQMVNDLFWTSWFGWSFVFME